jgi:predicted TIM-barrel fold metal-dependent hydrolase
MTSDDLILISVDDHVVEPPTMFDQHLAPEWKARAPRVADKKDGSQMWLFEGAQLPNIGLNAVVGRVPEEYGVEPTSYAQMRKGCWDVDARIEDMNANGVLGSMCFPSFPSFCGALWHRTQDKNLARAMSQAYNDWHIDEWCGSHPGRFIPLMIPPIWDPKLVAEEVRRVAKKGCHVLSFTENPGELGLPGLHHEAWDPVWEACADEGTTIAIHIGSAKGMVFTSPEAPVDVMITISPMSLSTCAADLVWSSILRRYPTLKFALSEGGVGWIPYFLERIDYVYAHHRRWTFQDFGGLKPSDVFKRQIITCFIDDRIGVKLRHEVGLENLTWECDYPHSDTTWPRSPEILWESLVDVPPHEIDMITHENAMRHFRFDPFAVREKEQCRVKALRAESPDVDLTLKSAGGKPPREEGAGVITTQDITSQLATAFQSPFEDDAGSGPG